MTTSTPTAPRTIVYVVDDEQSNVDLMFRVLSKTYSVHGFSDPTLALESARRLPPELVLTDFRMPKLNGVELLRALRLAGIRCASLLVTGYADLEELQAAEREKLVSRIIAKPWRIAELKTQADLALGLHRLQKPTP